MRLGLKEAEGKFPSRRTEITYKAALVDEFAKSDEVHTTANEVNVTAAWKESYYS